MARPRPRPRLLHEKLLAIREFLNVGKSEMANKIQAEILAHSGRQYQLHPSRIWDFEKGKREPSLFVLIAYIHLGHVHLESLVDDDLTTDKFRKRLGREIDHATLKRPNQKTRQMRKR